MVDHSYLQIHNNTFYRKNNLDLTFYLFHVASFTNENILILELYLQNDFTTILLEKSNSNKRQSNKLAAFRDFSLAIKFAIIWRKLLILLDRTASRKMQL